MQEKWQSVFDIGFIGVYNQSIYDICIFLLDHIRNDRTREGHFNYNHNFSFITQETSKNGEFVLFFEKKERQKYT